MEDQIKSKKTKEPGDLPSKVVVDSDNLDKTPEEKVDFTNFLAHANHPFVVFFTLLFKVSAAIM